MKIGKNEILFDNQHRNLKPLPLTFFDDITIITICEVHFCLKTLIKETQRGRICFEKISFINIHMNTISKNAVTSLVEHSKKLKSIVIDKCSFKTYDTKPLLHIVASHPSLRSFEMVRSDCCAHIGKDAAIVILKNKRLTKFSLNFVDDSRNCKSNVFYEPIDEAIKHNWILKDVSLGDKTFKSITRRNVKQRKNAINSIVSFILSQKKTTKISKLPKDVVVIVSKLLLMSCKEPNVWYDPNLLQRVMNFFI